MRSRPTGPDDETVRLVILREIARCLVCGKELSGSRGWNWSIHHRRGRDGKPDSHQPQNLILVCGADNVSGCHGLIHRSGKGVERKGWWLSRVRGTDPLTAPVLVDRESRWVYLTADGQYSDGPPGDPDIWVTTENIGRW